MPGLSIKPKHAAGCGLSAERPDTQGTSAQTKSGPQRPPRRPESSERNAIPSNERHARQQLTFAPAFPRRSMVNEIAQN
jgi:hypothetical protein